MLMTPTRQVLLQRERERIRFCCVLYHVTFRTERERKSKMTKVFIGNLSDDAKGHHVEDFFSKHGTLKEITLKNGFGKKLTKISHILAVEIFT